MVTVSVVVPTVDGGELLRASVESLRGQLPGSQLEVILVDNGSSDSSASEAAASIGGRVIRNESNIGYAPACNQGAEQATGTFLLFLNSDAMLEQGALGALVEAAQNDRQGAFWQPLTLSQDGSHVDSAGDLFTWSGFFWHLTEPPSDLRPSDVFAAKGACLLVRRQAFEELGGFRDWFFAYFEESDLCWRARMSGYEVRVIPAARVRHAGGATTARVLAPDRIYHLSFRNRLATILANASVPALPRILMAHLPACLGVALAFLIRGQPRSAAAVIGALIWPVAHPGRILRDRRESQALRRVPDRLVFRTGIVASLTVPRARRLLSGTLNRWRAS